jgi:hypothetical protein
LDTGQQRDVDSEEYAAVAPEARANYQDSVNGAQGVVERMRDALGGVAEAGDTETENLAGEDAGVQRSGGTTDYVSSNYSPDAGQPPTEADIADISENYT